MSDTDTASKHICVVHGYILAGTGSNIYSVNLAMTTTGGSAPLRRRP